MSSELRHLFTNMVSSLDQLSQRVSSHSRHCNYKEKIMSALTQNEYTSENLTKDVAIRFAVDYLQDYHDELIEGIRSSDNLDPTEEDMSVFVDIIIAILVEQQVIMPFGNLPKLQKELLFDFKKHYYMSETNI